MHCIGPRLAKTLKQGVLLLAVLGHSATWCTVSLAQLRIVSYNPSLSPGEGMDVVLQAIGAESINDIARPVDVLALQEQVSMDSTTQQIVDLLNGLYGPDVYQRSTLDGDTWGAGRPGLVYNRQTVQLVQEVAVGQLDARGGVRQTLRYRLRPAGYDRRADFYLYNSHMKGMQEDDNPQRRDAEAKAIRADADALGEGVHIIYAGDFNLYSSAEPAYQTLRSNGPGQALDPLSRPGVWHNGFSLRSLHTQSSTRSEGENRVGGGMDDRFDFQLVSQELLDGQGLGYIGPGVPNLEVAASQHSYRAFGNNGTHRINGDVSTGRGASPTVLEALEEVSDHLPVVADYQLPARMAVSVDPVPARVLQGSELNLVFSVTNTAPVRVARGADRLQYAALGRGAVEGAIAAVDDPLGGGNQHRLALRTDSVGTQRGTLSVVAQSDQVPDPLLQQAIVYDVVGHSHASFDPRLDQNVLVLDLGSFPQNSGEGVEQAAYVIHNLAGSWGDTAGLELQLAGAAGDESAPLHPPGGIPSRRGPERDLLRHAGHDHRRRVLGHLDDRDQRRTPAGCTGRRGPGAAAEGQRDRLRPRCRRATPTKTGRSTRLISWRSSRRAPT